MVYPVWLAPNLITMVGLCVVQLVALAQMFFSQGFTTDVPRWWFLFAAVGIFIYQTLDGSDGKQARRCKCGSPLGELFDHGVDALVTSLIFGLNLSMLGLGHPEQNSMAHWLSFWGLMLTQTAFFFSNLTLLHTETQEFNAFDCQEIQVTMQAGLIATYLYPTIWETQLTFPFPLADLINLMPSYYLQGWTVGTNTFVLKGLIQVPPLFFMVFNITKQIYGMFMMYSDEFGQTERVLKIGQGPRALTSHCLTMLSHIAMCMLVWRCACHLEATQPSPDQHLNALFAYFIVSMYAFGDLMNRALLTRVGQTPFPALHHNRGVWCLGLLLVAVQPAVDAICPLGKWIVVCFTVALHTQYSVMMGTAITKCLGIQFFRIKVPDELTGAGHA